MPISKYVPKIIHDFIDTYDAYFMSRVQLAQKNPCPHTKLLSKLTKATDHETITKYYSYLRAVYFNQSGVFDPLFHDKTASEQKRYEIIESVAS